MTAHDQTLLGPYVLGVLGPAEARQVEEHLSGCDDCRDVMAELEQTTQLLGDVPPEAFLDGPPTDGDLLLQRTLRAARAMEEEQPSRAVAPRRRNRWLVTVAAAAVVVAMAAGGGVLVGRETAGQSPAPTAGPVAGSRHATATEGSTAIATTVEPRAGWSWVNVRLTGLKAGAECEMVVTDTAGRTHVAGSWVVSPQGAREGSAFSGGVQVPIDQVASVEVKNAQGDHVVTVTL